MRLKPSAFFLEYVKKIKPKYVLIENVIGIRTKADDIIKNLNNIGYVADFRVIQASDYGIPQNRKRIFFFAVKKTKIAENKVKNFFSIMENFKDDQNKVVLKDALFNLRKLKTKKFKNDRNEYYDSGLNIEKQKNNNNFLGNLKRAIE